MSALDELDQLLGLGKKQRPLPKTLQASGYSHVRELGAGGFGAALLLYNATRKDYVVAKHINLGTMSLKQRRLAHNEIDILQRMTHPNIVRYIEYTEESNHLYILMEYADGGDLYSLIKKLKSRGQKMSEEQAVSLFLQVAMAVKYMHDQKMLHRDIKSQNIFLTKSHVVKLGDFGISTVLQNTVAMAKTMCGTPCYFSPELCMGHEYNNKSDVWALGVLLYEMLTLKLPFEISNMKKLLDSIVNCPPPVLPSHWSSGMRSLVAAMLEKDPRKRPDINGVLRHAILREKIPGLVESLTDVCPKPNLEKSPLKAAAPPAAAGRYQASAPPSAQTNVPLPPIRKEKLAEAPPPAVATNQPPAPPPRGLAARASPPVEAQPVRAAQPAQVQPAAITPQAPGGGRLGLAIPSRIANDAARERMERERSPPPAAPSAVACGSRPEPAVELSRPTRTPSPPAVEADTERRPPRVIPSRMPSGGPAASASPPTRTEPTVGSTNASSSGDGSLMAAGAEALMLAEPSPQPQHPHPSAVPVSQAASGTSGLRLTDVQSRKEISEEPQAQQQHDDSAAVGVVVRSSASIETDADEYESLVSVIRNLQTLDTVLSPGGSKHSSRPMSQRGGGVVSATPVKEASPSAPASNMQQLHNEALVMDSPSPAPAPCSGTEAVVEEDVNCVHEEEEGADDDSVQSFVDPFGTRLDMNAAFNDSIRTDLDATMGDDDVVEADATGGVTMSTGSVFEVVCLCQKIRLLGNFQDIYGSFKCKCDVCRKQSGGSSLNLLHLPDVAKFSELNCAPVGEAASGGGGIDSSNNSSGQPSMIHLPASYRDPKSGSVAHFCSTCGCLLGLDHAGIDGCVVVKAALSEKSHDVLMADLHSTPPEES